MTAKTFMTALGSVDDRFITESADTQSIKELFGCDDNIIARRNKKIRIKKLLIAAIIAILLIAVAVSVTADVFNYRFPDGIITIDGKVLTVNLLENPGKAVNISSTDNEIVKELTDFGIPDVVLPTEIIENWEKAKETEHQRNREDVKTSEMRFQKDDMTVDVFVTWYDSEKDIGNTKINNTRKGEMLTVNGLSVHLFYHGKGLTTALYVNGTTLYNLTFNWTDYDKAMEIMKTIAQ